MVQFNLPDNSKLTDGDYYKLEAKNKSIKKRLYSLISFYSENDK